MLAQGVVEAIAKEEPVVEKQEEKVVETVVKEVHKLLVEKVL